MITETSDADPHSMQAYREQSVRYRAAMRSLLQAADAQTAAFVAVQAVRSAASYALAALTRRIAHQEDAIAVLWQTAPCVRLAEALQDGADVLALHDDLTLYAYNVDMQEAQAVARSTEAFCEWALSLIPAAEAPLRSMGE